MGSVSGLGRSPGEGIGYPLQSSGASLAAQLVKNLPAMWETWAQSLGWEDPLEKGKATHSSTLAWRISWTVYPWGLKESDTTEQLSLSLSPQFMEKLSSMKPMPGAEAEAPVLWPPEVKSRLIEKDPEPWKD